jgi:hypothetical protein
MGVLADRAVGGYLETLVVDTRNDRQHPIRPAQLDWRAQDFATSGGGAVQTDPADLVVSEVGETLTANIRVFNN